MGTQDEVISDLNLLELKFTERRAIANYEEVLAPAEWIDTPSDEAICCGSIRTYWAVLREENAVINMRCDSRWDGDKQVLENIRYDQFHGVVRLTQFSKCGSYFHRFTVQPLFIENGGTVFMVRDATKQPRAVPGSPFGYSEDQDGWWARSRRGREDNWWELRLPYTRDPHGKKCWEYHEGCDDLRSPPRKEWVWKSS